MLHRHGWPRDGSMKQVHIVLKVYRDLRGGGGGSACTRKGAGPVESLRTLPVTSVFPVIICRIGSHLEVGC